VKDLTKGSISKHILVIAVPVAFGLFTQVAYQLINLYFLTRIGSVAVAGVNVAGTVIFIVMALTQVLGVGTASLVSYAAGRNRPADANLAFNQSIMLSAVCGVLTLLLLYAFMGVYMRWVATDAGTIQAGLTYMRWALPGVALMCPWTVVAAALRGSGIVRPTIVIYTLTLVVDAILAPILIVGWGTGVAMGVQGAGLAYSISISIGVAALSVYFHRVEKYIVLTPSLMHPKLRQWRRVLSIGLPAGTEFALVFFSTAIAYYAIRSFGPSAQAGLGIGTQVVQTILLPGIAIAVAAGPIAGQSFGAEDGKRVKETFRNAILIGTAAMILTTLLVQRWSDGLLAMFDADDSAIAIASLFLQLRSWGFVAQGLGYVCSSMFQSLGNTMPALISSAVRFLLFSVPAVWLSAQPDFRIEQVWYLWVASVTLHAVIGLWMLRVEFQRRLTPTTI